MAQILCVLSSFVRSKFIWSCTAQSHLTAGHLYAHELASFYSFIRDGEIASCTNLPPHEL